MSVAIISVIAAAACSKQSRADVTYAQTWSPWLDLQILLRTPRAVVEGGQ
jgi:lipopolysaccharide/colanic/teichoic acid biosynthesis glycosyltransferase